MNSYITRYSEFMFVYKEILLILTKLRLESLPARCVSGEGLVLLRLQVGVFLSYVFDAGAGLLGVKIVMSNDHCTRIAAMEVCQ